MAARFRKHGRLFIAAAPPGFHFDNGLLGLFKCPLWLILAKRWTKKVSLILGIGLMGLSGAIVYPLFPEGQMVGPMIYGVIVGVMIASVVWLDAALADVIDYDQWKFGKEPAGI